MADVILKFPKDALEWHRTSNTLVALSVQDEYALLDLEDKLKDSGMHYISFREPDIGDELTAIAIMPSEQAKDFCKGLPLALKNYAPVAQLVRAADSKSAGVVRTDQGRHTGVVYPSAQGACKDSPPTNAPVAQSIEQQVYNLHVEGLRSSRGS